jgi:hypothetical protein
MLNRLTAVEVESILNRLTSALPHDACQTCECFQGFLVQLLIDADQEAARLVASHRVERGAMHGCLGCDPCPPGDQYADYRAERRADSRGADQTAAPIRLSFRVEI